MTYYSVDQAVRDTGYTRGEIIALFKQLAKRGVGHFKTGRKGWPSRLETGH